jgi:histidine triad (HIT) family protein
MDCLFCKIARKEIPATIHYEDDAVLCFEDIAPQAPTHLLLIPKIHRDNILALEEEDGEVLGKLLLAAGKIGKEKNLPHFRLIANTGAEAGQTVFHLHIHLLGGKSFHEDALSSSL